MPTFNHLAIQVVDLDKSINFYQKIIGLDTLPNPFNDNLHAWVDMGGGAELHIIQGAKSVGEHPQHNHFCFSVHL